jgi:hypothetical protein
LGYHGISEDTLGYLFGANSQMVAALLPPPADSILGGGPARQARPDSDPRRPAPNGDRESAAGGRGRLGQGQRFMRGLQGRGGEWGATVGDSVLERVGTGLAMDPDGPGKAGSDRASAWRPCHPNQEARPASTCAVRAFPRRRSGDARAEAGGRERRPHPPLSLVSRSTQPAQRLG